ncbi:MAG TPA: rhodanese-like domain-containing protein [Pseudomonadales bacterium]|nr:rhodanese-like domain-containing protein [Pseudomonadales bacterium]
MGYREMIDAAEAVIETLDVEQAMALHGDPAVRFVDLRDVRELWREGTIPGAAHCPRGMLEFWIDADSPYHKPLFSEAGVRYLFFCQSGWRSALATRTAGELGLENAAHVAGGFRAWVDAGGPVATVERPAK